MSEENLDVNADSEVSDESILAEGSDDKVKSEGEETSEETDETSEESEEETEETEEEQDEETEETEEKEEKLVEELTEEEQEQEKLITRPSWAELKKNFPGIEKNREVREVYFREKQYSEIFTNPEEAKTANSKAGDLDTLDNALVQGRYDIVLGSMNDGVREKFVTDIIPALYRLDKNLFQKATSPLFVEMAHEIHAFAVKNEDENLKKSILNVSKYLFGKHELPERTARKSPELDKERQQLNEERQRDFNGKVGDFRDSADKLIVRGLEKIILNGLNITNEWTRNAILRDVKQHTLNSIYSDKNFFESARNLYQQAIKAGMRPEHKARIVTTILARAKGIALKYRAEARAAALGKRPDQISEKDKPKRIEGRKTETTRIVSKEKKDNKFKSDMDIILEGVKN